jgi:ABC-type nickel/cobalt efflux system permease component RcnA
MLHGEVSGLLLGAVALGAVHGIEPGHGWPVAASYALNQANRWLYGLAASLIIGVGHLVSSIAMVAAFFYAKSYFELTEVDDPITLVGDIQVGGPVSVVAGLLLIGLGIREYRHGHSHGSHDGRPHGSREHGHSDPDNEHTHSNDSTHGESHDHSHEDSHDHDHSHEGSHDHDHSHDHPHDHDHSHEDSHDHDHPHDSHDHDSERSGGVLARVTGVLPFVGGQSRAHGHNHDAGEATERGLFGIAWFAFVLGFAHEEEFEIIALCAGSEYCLELMTAYALTVIVGIVGLTMLLIAGYQHYEERVERYTPYLPVVSAVVLVTIGLGFVAGVL